MASAAQLHRDQLGLFRREVRKLRPLLEDARGSEVLFGGTITTQSGRAVAMVAPVRHPPPRKFELDGHLIAVLWLTSGSRQSRVEHRLRPGVYGLRLLREGGDGARLEFVAPNRRVAHSAPGVLGLARDDVWDKIKKLLKDLGLEVDVKVLFGGGKNEPSEVRISAAFWSFHLFDDP
jgi:hypothetical protein